MLISENVVGLSIWPVRKEEYTLCDKNKSGCQKIFSNRIIYLKKICAICVPSRIHICIFCIFLNKLPSRWYLIAHQHGEEYISLYGRLDTHLLQQPVRRVHGGYP